ncbi:MAG TPA: 1-phosphofructokinase family hexose kinase [Symbiobacteriaceae bacterium]|nr:1-phosphofructokinase family hexose kinase [Symbiobacteriaceae bacterium]
MERYALTVSLNAAVDTSYIFDGFAVGEIHTVAELQRVAGGKANNVARVLRLLGAPVVATGFAGGKSGAFIQEDLAACGIEASYEAIPGESRTCLAMVDRVGGTLTEVREKGPTIPAEAAAAFLARFERLLTGARVVVLSGSLPPGISVDYYGRLVALARARGVFTLLDCSGAALKAALPAEPSLVKPNREELAGWLGTPDVVDFEDAAQKMRLAGARAVAVSLGKDGLMYVGPEGTWRVKPPAVEAVNTVGSGDSLVAGFTAGLLAGRPLPEALRLGVACGTANALTKGVASPRVEDIGRIVPQVIVE